MEYIVKVLKLSGLSNKVYEAGDKVNETCFPEGNCKQLVEQGFLEEVIVEDEVVVKQAPEKKK